MKHRLAFASLVTLLGSGLAGCSSSTGATIKPAGTTLSGNVTWADGTALSDNTIIAADATVTIAAGATIQVAPGKTITVRGKLLSAGGAKAKITSSTWEGLVVADGATLTLTGVDIENAVTGVEITGAAAAASYDGGTITAATHPFLVQHGGSLTTDHAVVVGSKGTSEVQGTLTATHLDYDANGNDGIEAADPAAVISIEDSTLHGIGSGLSDMITSYVGAAKIHVAYTTIEKVHCAFHFESTDVQNIDVQYVTATGDTNGMMLYDTSSSGTKTFANSNFYGNQQYGIDEKADAINGVVTFTNCFINGNPLGDAFLKQGTSVQIVSPATAKVDGAAPRSM